MGFETALETQRLKLLRLVAGWLVAVGFVSVGFPLWIRKVMFSVLTHAEAAAQYLVIAQARVIAARGGRDLDCARFFECAALDVSGFETEPSLPVLRQRLEALRTLLENLPRFGERLLRRVEKRVRRLLRSARARQTLPKPGTPELGALWAWRLADIRIERPPDKISGDFCSQKPPPGTGREAKEIG